jgi:hypothetical protein
VALGWLKQRSEAFRTSSHSRQSLTHTLTLSLSLSLSFFLSLPLSLSLSSSPPQEDNTQSLFLSSTGVWDFEWFSSSLFLSSFFVITLPFFSSIPSLSQVKVKSVPHVRSLSISLSLTHSLSLSLSPHLSLSLVIHSSPSYFSQVFAIICHLSQSLVPLFLEASLSSRLSQSNHRLRPRRTRDLSSSSTDPFPSFSSRHFASHLSSFESPQPYWRSSSTGIAVITVIFRIIDFSFLGQISV